MDDTFPQHYSNLCRGGKGGGWPLRERDEEEKKERGGEGKQRGREVEWLREQGRGGERRGVKSFDKGRGLERGGERVCGEGDSENENERWR